MTDEERQIVCDNLKLVDYIIQKRLHIPVYDSYYEDYQQQGRLALVLATTRYDESKGFAFTTYASSYIENMIRTYRREYVYGTIRVSRSAKDLYSKVVPLHEQGYTQTEIVELLDITNDLYMQVVASVHVKSIYETFLTSRDDEVSLIDALGTEDKHITEMGESERLSSYIEKVASTYKKDRDKTIWRDYIYGKYLGYKITEKGLAKKYNTSQPQVHRVLKKGKAKLEIYLRRD